jgi:NAD-dependent dihydropyrimidine dehydrogenase PreA subunit
MPAHEWEIARAEEEGVVIHNSLGPVAVTGEQAVSGLRLKKCLSAFDAAGNFNPAYDEEITEKIDAAHVILAVGQTADLAYVEGLKGIDANKGRIVVDEADLSTGDEGVFAGGDVVSGPDSIIGAIAHGRKAASAIDAYLGGDGSIDEVLAAPEDEVVLPPFVMEIRPRNEIPLLKPWQRTTDFAQVEMGLSGREIADEAARCLNCDARKFEVVLNTEYCKECGYCSEVCRVDTFGPAEGFNAKGYRSAEVKSSNWCVGCFKCYFACPDFAIDVTEITA